MKTTVRQLVSPRQPLATLGIITVLGLTGCALSSVFLLLQIGQVIVPIVIVDVFLLVIAGLVATGIRWLPLLGAMDALGTMIGGLVTQQYFSYHLTHPSQVGFFAAALLVYAFGVVSLLGGVSATVQNYRSHERRSPRWLLPVLTTLAGFVCGAIVVAMLSQAPAEASVASGTTTVHLGVNTFNPATVTIAKGTKLVLVDDGQFAHVIGNGTWVNGVARPSGEAGAPTVNNLQINGNSATIGPFNTAGTYHIYCLIHPDMNLTVIVQ